MRNTDCDITRACSITITKKILLYICDMMLYFSIISTSVTCVKFILEFACFQGLKLSWNWLCCFRHRRFNDNFRWRHWHRSWHYDSSRFSTGYAISLYNVVSWDLPFNEYRKDAPWLARKGEVRGVLCGFIIWKPRVCMGPAFSALATLRVPRDNPQCRLGWPGQYCDNSQFPGSVHQLKCLIGF